MKKNWFKEKSKIIRDAVHGDILIDKKYINIINSREFQRLRRIKQLSVANIVFPSAEHTRFSHSIGTFFIMKKIISHLEAEYKELGLSISEEEKENVLLSALLHDIGHGPFSHAFENLIPGNKKEHETWTIDIIISPETEVNKNLIANFKEDTPQKVAALIKKEKTSSRKDLNLTSLLSSLISSQIDADRLDYLIRDSYHTGVKFGNIDIDRLISALKVTTHNDEYTLYIPQKYLNDIEEYLFSRYQMNKSVYFHSTKVEFEQMIKFIFKRALEKKDELNINELLKDVFDNNLNVLTYCKLDESLFLYYFQEWKNSKDEILNLLCEAYLDRKKFLKINILDNSSLQIKSFKRDLVEIIGDVYSENYFDDKYYLMEVECDYSMYKNQKENIKILDSRGKLRDFSEISEIFSNPNENGILLYNKYSLVYINLDILKATHEDLGEDSINRIEKLIEVYDFQNHLEVEKKYTLLNQNEVEKIKNYLSENYNVKSENIKYVNQEDLYYDTSEYDFFHNKENIRIRTKNNKKILTYKADISKGNEDILNGQYERFEYEKEVLIVNNSIIFDFIKERNKGTTLDDKDKLEPKLLIKNKRIIYEISYKDTKLEISFDSFTFNKPTEETELGKDFQIEIELKSEYFKKINLINFCKELENKFPDIIKVDKESKFEKGKKLIE